MATDTVDNEVSNIGGIAGLIWNYLDQNGPVTLTRLAKEIEVAANLRQQGTKVKLGKVKYYALMIMSPHWPRRR